MSAYLQRTRALATAALLAFAVCFGLAFATQAYAESSGGGDTQQLVPAQGLTAQAGEWRTGAGTEADPYVISDAAGLQKLADDVNSGANGVYANTYFKLDADIDLSGIANWTPIGYTRSTSSTGSKYFAGTFDGDFHTVKGLTINAPAKIGSDTSYTYGLFGAVGGATIKNLIVSGSMSMNNDFETNGAYAGVVGWCVNDSLFLENVGNEVTINDTQTNTGTARWVAGVLGRSTYPIRMIACYNKADITSMYGHTGGLLGQYNSSNQSLFIACYNAGKIINACGNGQNNLNSNNDVGGLVGSLGTNWQPFRGCFNYGEVSYRYYDGSNQTGYGAFVGAQHSANEASSGVYYLEKNMYRYTSATDRTLLADQPVGRTNTYSTYTMPAAVAVDAATLKSADTIAEMNRVATAVEYVKGGFKTGKDYPVLYWEASGAPTITEQPVGYDVTAGGTATALTIAAVKPAEGEAGADGVLTYQWYKDGEVIESATSASFTPDVSTVGVIDYHCVVTNTFTLDGETITATVASDVATVNVQDTNKASTPTVAMTLAASASQSDKINATVAVTGLEYTDGKVAYKLEQSAEGATFEAVEGTAEVENGTANILVPVNTYTIGENTVTITVTNTYQLTKTAEGADTKTITISGKTIGTADELADFAADVNGGNAYENLTITITADIDLATLSEGKTFAPIGTSSTNSFKGEIAGGGHKIEGLAIEGMDYAALVGYANGANIHDLEVFGTVSGTNYVAGIVAYGADTTVTRVANHATITQSGRTAAAGVVGFARGNSTVSAAYNDAAITGKGNVAGIVGSADKVAVSDCYNVGVITFTGEAGDLAYANGCAGIVGRSASSNVTIANTYNAGAVIVPEGATRSFGSIAYTQDTSTPPSSPECSNVYYLEGTSPVSVGRNAIDNYDGTALYAETVKPLTTATLPAAYTTLGDGWQQAPTNYHGGYPALAWESVPEAALVTFSIAEPVENLHLTLSVDGQTVAPAVQENGTYTALLPAGTYSYTAEAFGYVTQTAEFTVSNEPLNVTIPAFVESARQEVTFTVTNSGGEAIDNPSIVVKNGEGMEMEAAEGVYSLPDGTYAYTVSAKGYIAKSDAFTVAGAPVAQAVVLEVLPPEWDGELISEPSQENGVYQIGHAAELAWLAQEVNAGNLEAPVNAVLTDDIALNDKTWTPIGNATNPFVGSFDGQGHAVEGLYAKAASANDYIGLFGNVGNAEVASAVKNVVIAGELDADGRKVYVGGVAAAILNTAVENCASSVELKNLYDGMPGAGGIVGAVKSGGTSSISACQSSSAIASSRDNYGEYFGGIVGKNSQDNLTIDSCYFTGSFGTIYAYVGGIIGQSGSAVTLSNCFSTANFSANKNSSGLIAGVASSATYTNCYYAVPVGSAISQATGQATDPAGITKLDSAADLATANLGDKFVSKPWVNDGVPVLTWEKTPNAAKVAFTVADAPEDTAITMQLGGADPIAAEKQADGSFAAYITDDVQGEYSYTAKAFGYIAKTGTVTVAAEDQTIGLGAFEEAAKQTVTFSVSSAEQGIELENLNIVVTNDLGNDVVANEDGTYSLPAGNYAYKVTARKHLPKTGELAVADAALTQDVTLEVVPAWDGENTLEPELVDGVYQVGNAQELAWVANKVNGLGAAEDVNVKLIDDIDLNDKAWTPIGKNNPNYYRGTFDGDGHTISGLNIPDTYNGAYVGLFGQTGVSVNYSTTYPATIKNLVVKGAVSAATSSSEVDMGGIVGRAVATTFENCGNEAEISYTPGYTTYLGGIVGYIDSSGVSSVSGCYNAGSVSALGTESPYNMGVGGIIGTNRRGSLSISNCYNTGVVTAVSKAGGIIGYSYNSFKLNGSFAIGSVMSPGTAGVLSGQDSYNTNAFTNCYVFVPEDSTCTSVYNGSATAPSGVTKVDSATDITAEALGESFKGDRVFVSSTPLLAWQPKTGDPLALDSNDLDVSIADVFGLGAEPEVSASYAGKDFTLGNDQVALAFYADADCTELRVSPEMGTNYAKVIAKDEGDFTGSMVVSFKKALTKYKPLEGTAYFSITNDDGKFFVSDGENSGVVMWRVPIDLSEVSKLDLDDYNLSRGKMDAQEPGATYLYETTLLQLLVYAQYQYQADPESLDAGSMGTYFKSYFGHNENLMYYINGEYPLIPGETAMGNTSNNIPLSDGDDIAVTLWPEDDEYGMFMFDSGFGFLYFQNEFGVDVYEYEAVAGAGVDVALSRAGLDCASADSTWESPRSAAGSVDIYHGAEYGESADPVTTDANGKASILFEEPGTYYVWADAQEGEDWAEGEHVTSAVMAKVVVKTIDEAKADLADAIEAAQDAMVGIEVSEDGSDVTTDKRWVTPETVDALQAAIDGAQDVVASSEVTPDQVADALTAIKAATKTFEDAVADGTRPLATAEQIADAETVLYNAERALEGVYKSEDGSDLEDGAKWAPADKIDAVRDAIVNLGRTLGTESLPADVLDEATAALVEAVSNFKDAEKTGPLAEYKQLEGTAYVSVSYDGKFVEGNDDTLLALVPVDLAELSQIDLDSYGYGAFKKAAPENADYKYETSVLQLAIYLHEKYYADGVDGLAGYDSDPEGNWGPAHTFGISKFWGNDNPVISYNVNAEMGATTLDGLYPDDGDLIEFNMFAGSYYGDDNAGSLYFYDSAEAQYTEVAKTFEAIAGEPATINVRKVVSSFDPVTWEPVYSVASVEGLAVSYGVKYGEALGTAMADADGNVSITFPDEGTYCVWADGIKGAGEGVDYAVTSPAFATVEAWDDSRDEYKQLYGMAYVSVSHDGKFEVSGKSGTTVMANVPVDLYEVSQIDLDEYGFSAYKKAATEANADYKYETSLLQLAIYLHENYYVDGIEGFAVSESSYVPGTVSVDKLWGHDTRNLSYNVNGEMGMDTLDSIFPQDGDVFDFNVFEGSTYGDPNSGSLYFYADGEAVYGDICSTYEAEPGVETTLNVRKVVSTWVSEPTEENPWAGHSEYAAVAVEGVAVSYGTTYGEALGTAMADADGNVKITFPDAGKYFVWADGLKGATEGTSGYAVSSPACATAIVGTSPAAEDDLKQLARDIRNAERALNNVASSADGSDITDDETWATDEQIAAFEKAIENAKEVVEDSDASAADVAAASEALAKAKSEFQAATKNQTGVKASESTMDDLAKAIESAKSTNATGASDEAKQALDAAIAEAESLAKNPNASSADVAAAKTKLIEAANKVSAEAAAAAQAASDKAKANDGLPVGSTFTVKDANGTWTYKVTAAKQVTLTKAAKTKKKGKATINTVAYMGVTYNVTAVGSKALASSKLKAVTVGDNVTSIGAQAFAKNKVLNKLVVGKNVAKIGAKAFTKAKKLKKLTIKSDKLTAPASVKGSLKGSKVKSVKVPKAQKKAYKKTFAKKNCGKKVKVK